MFPLFNFGSSVSFFLAYFKCYSNHIQQMLLIICHFLWISFPLFIIVWIHVIRRNIKVIVSLWRPCPMFYLVQMAIFIPHYSNGPIYIPHLCSTTERINNEHCVLVISISIREHITDPPFVSIPKYQTAFHHQQGERDTTFDLSSEIIIFSFWSCDIVSTCFCSMSTLWHG